MLFLFLSAKIVQGEQESNFSPTFYFCLPHPKQHTRRADPAPTEYAPPSIPRHIGDKVVKIGM